MRSFTWLVLILTLVFVSCSQDDNPVQPDQEPEKELVKLTNIAVFSIDYSDLVDTSLSVVNIDSVSYSVYETEFDTIRPEYKSITLGFTISLMFHDSIVVFEGEFLDQAIGEIRHPEVMKYPLEFLESIENPVTPTEIEFYDMFMLVDISNQQKSQIWAELSKTNVINQFEWDQSFIYYFFYAPRDNLIDFDLAKIIVIFQGQRQEWQEI